MSEIRPMSLEVYKAIVEDFTKLGSYNRKAENELRKKYKRYIHTSFGSSSLLLSGGEFTLVILYLKTFLLVFSASHFTRPLTSQASIYKTTMYILDIRGTIALHIFIHKMEKVFLFCKKIWSAEYFEDLSDLLNKVFIPISIAPSTMGSILSLLIQRSMKQSYRKSPSISSRYHELFDQIMKDKKKNNVIQVLSDNQGISPALFARSLLQGAYTDPTMAKKCFKDTTLIEDKDLAYQVFLGIMNDNQYGPYADIIKQSIGLEYELRLEKELRTMNITFSDENVLRARGYDKTPDFKLDVPIAVDGFIVNWIESKALFGDEENHSGYLKEQLLCYWNRFGPGLVIYWFGYLETLESTPEVNNMFILRCNFPNQESITQYKVDF